MTTVQQQQIIEAHFALPKECRYAPASQVALAVFETQFGSIPSDYRWYLTKCGGGVIGSDWIDGIEQLPETHSKFMKAQERGFYTLRDFFPIGWDGSGNPYGIDLRLGRIITEDHDFGGVHEVADNFYNLLYKKGLIK